MKDLKDALVAWADRNGGLAPESVDLFMHECEHALMAVLDGFGAPSEIASAQAGEKDDEVVKLKAFLSHPHPMPEYQAKQDLKLAWIADETPQHQLYVATMEYFATGEGVSQGVFAAMASSKADFMRKMAEKWGYYYSLGTEIYDAYPEDDRVLQSLAGRGPSAAIKNFFEKPDCFYSFDATQYMNCS